MVIKTGVPLFKKYPKSDTLSQILTETYNAIGSNLYLQNKYGEAIEAFYKALEFKSDYASPYNNLGIIFEKQNNNKKSEKSFLKALELNPKSADCYRNLGNLYAKQKKIKESINSYKNAEKFSLNQELFIEKLHQQAFICDWTAFKEFSINRDRIDNQKTPSLPFPFLAFEDNPAKQLLRSKKYAHYKFNSNQINTPKKSNRNNKKLRLGYFSADFHNHATMYLIAKLIDIHDRSKFEIYIYSFGPNHDDEMRRRLINSSDNFKDIRELSDESIHNLVKNDEIDIVIDLKGYTMFSRPIIFSNRLAPIQISYLGYPGSMGAEFIDYIIADKTVIPKTHQKYYSEKILYLPNSYQVNDNTRNISKAIIKRKDFNLPETAFIFCCFNNTFKISSREFTIWMRLLKKIDNSILWLLKSNDAAENNLKNQAEIYSIDKNRIIFASILPQEEHLARLRLADLFLDTFNYNAHTTCSDALWAGLPVVTKIGNQFSARVSASLLNAIGVPELITESEEEYEILAENLAINKNKLKEIKKILLKNQSEFPLFNTELFTKHIEEAYTQAYQLFLEKKSPATIYVK